MIGPGIKGHRGVSRPLSGQSGRFLDKHRRANLQEAQGRLAPLQASAGPGPGRTSATRYESPVQPVALPAASNAVYEGDVATGRSLYISKAAKAKGCFRKLFCRSHRTYYVEDEGKRGGKRTCITDWAMLLVFLFVVVTYGVVLFNEHDNRPYTETITIVDEEEIRQGEVDGLMKPLEGEDLEFPVIAQIVRDAKCFTSTEIENMCLDVEIKIHSNNYLGWGYRPTRPDILVSDSNMTLFRKQPGAEQKCSPRVLEAGLDQKANCFDLRENRNDFFSARLRDSYIAQEVYRDSDIDDVMGGRCVTLDICPLYATGKDVEMDPGIRNIEDYSQCPEEESLSSSGLSFNAFFDTPRIVSLFYLYLEYESAKTLVEGWDYEEEFLEEFEKITEGERVRPLLVQEMFQLSKDVLIELGVTIVLDYTEGTMMKQIRVVSQHTKEISLFSYGGTDELIQDCEPYTRGFANGKLGRIKVFTSPSITVKSVSRPTQYLQYLASFSGFIGSAFFIIVQVLGCLCRPASTKLTAEVVDDLESPSTSTTPGPAPPKRRVLQRTRTVVELEDLRASHSTRENARQHYEERERARQKEKLRSARESKRGSYKGTRPLRVTPRTGRDEFDDMR